MTRRIYAIAALATLSAACARPELSERDARTVAITEQLWEEHDLPGISGCGPLEVKRHDSLSDYANACAPHLAQVYKDAAKRSAACTKTRMVGVLSEQWHVIHVAPGYHENDGLIAHETLHYLTHCSGLGHLPDIFDAAHSRKAVWGEIEAEARIAVVDAAVSP